MRRFVVRTTTLIAFALTAVAHADGEGPAGLRGVPAKHYVIHTDIADGGLVKELARRMDVMYDQYSRALSVFKPAPDAAPLPVYLFATRKRYMAFTDYAGTNTGGLFVGGRRSYLTSYLDENGRDGLRRTLQHEAFHQFAYFTISRHLPIWLNEGMAQLFEEGIWTNRQFLLGQIPPRRVRQLQADVRAKKLVPFDAFLAVTPKQWADNLHASAEAGATYYNEAWAVAFFLQHGPDARYHKRFVDFLTKLHADPTADPQALFAGCFPDTADFQRAFERWAANMRPTPEATLLERQETLGDFLIGLAPKDARITRNMTQFRSEVEGFDVSLTYTRGAVRYTTVKPPNIYFADLDGRAYGDRQLFFQPSRGAPLPDIVCRPNGAFVLRTHFYDGPQHVEHENSIEPAGN